MSKSLYISLISINLVAIKTLSSNHRMYNLYTKFAKILEICKKYSENLVNESENKKQEIWQSFFAKVDNNRATKCTLVLFIPQL